MHFTCHPTALPVPYRALLLPSPLPLPTPPVLPGLQAQPAYLYCNHHCMPTSALLSFYYTSFCATFLPHTLPACHLHCLPAFAPASSLAVWLRAFCRTSGTWLPHACRRHALCCRHALCFPTPEHYWRARAGAGRVVAVRSPFTCAKTAKRAPADGLRCATRCKRLPACGRTRFAPARILAAATVRYQPGRCAHTAWCACLFPSAPHYYPATLLLFVCWYVWLPLVVADALRCACVWLRRVTGVLPRCHLPTRGVITTAVGHLLPLLYCDTVPVPCLGPPVVRFPLPLVPFPPVPSLLASVVTFGSPHWARLPALFLRLSPRALWVAACPGRWTQLRAMRIVLFSCPQVFVTAVERTRRLPSNRLRFTTLCWHLVGRTVGLRYGTRPSSPLLPPCCTGFPRKWSCILTCLLHLYRPDTAVNALPRPVMAFCARLPRLCANCRLTTAFAPACYLPVRISARAHRFFWMPFYLVTFGCSHAV